jgi:VIT1/CCC1 family predicted Fe2+/Mn2+ transporter
MKALNRIGNKFSSEARAGYALAGAALLVLPSVVVFSEGGAGATVWLVVSALFGIGCLTAAVFGGEMGGDGAGATARR